MVLQQAGRRDLSQEFLDAHKRQRVVAAVARLAHERGVARVTSAQIIAQAHMARGTFYALFGTKGGCLRFAFGEAFERVFAPVRMAGEANGPWLDRVRAVLDALFAATVREPLLAELCLVQAPSVAALSERSDGEAGVEVLAEAFRGGREAGREALGPSYQDPAPQIEQLLARGVLAITATRLRQGKAAELPGHRAELVQLIATPFLGTEKAPKTSRRLEVA